MVRLLALLLSSNWKLGLTMGLVLAVVGGVVPMLVNITWPLQLRLGHWMELFFTGMGEGLMMTAVLWVKREKIAPHVYTLLEIQVRRK